MKKVEKSIHYLYVIIFLLGFAGCQSNNLSPKIGNITEERLLNSDNEPESWFTGGRGYKQAYYSPLNDINEKNIKQLGFAWDFDIDFETAFQATPIVVDGTLFTAGNKGNVYALNAASGKLLWSFKPEIRAEVFDNHCCGGPNRGVAVWKGIVYVASIDGYLYALDAATGKQIWKIDTIVDRSKGYSSTGAPHIAKDLVLIGNSGGEYNARGYVSAYNINSGEMAWRFYTVPGDPDKGFEHPELEMAAKTWDPNSVWENGLGGTVWDAMAYDPELNILYVGTGNGAPWSRDLRSPAGGDNLFLNSILAINPDNGRLLWHYQTTPADNWDYTTTQKMILAELNMDGKERKVIMQAPKNGFFYVLDRETGELLSADPYVYVNWASHVDMKTGKPVETGKGDYSKSPKLIFPSSQGGHNWNPMAFNPNTGLVYIPTNEAGEIYSIQKTPFKVKEKGWNPGVSFRSVHNSSSYPEDWPPLEELTKGEPDTYPRSYLKAWDPVKRKVVWEVEIQYAMETLRHDRRYGGVMTTDGNLVFQGGIDGHLKVYEATTGKLLHDIDAGTSIIAAPMSYKIGNEQFVAVMAGVDGNQQTNADYLYGNKGRILAFKIGGGDVPKRPVLNRNVQLADKGDAANFSKAEIKLGQELYNINCTGCHNTGRAPKLLPLKANVENEFYDIVLSGDRLAKGMPSYKDVLSKKQVNAILSYLKVTDE
ncbi:PQQ-dependent dehydrogenase, methanol/ethanol family [Portibacter lacus]|uniref:Alcohol dehydrogenase n=1 Tax=Portibacter lacus TaxID=1099794 RepID=A0AA37SS63_9BACT|nr:PQQ-dependent dehydrogenase, methanol/ethanol family [Portibacter lacus]GLR18469.1 alcohol dehydrogenase [Portibacter lacus]